MKNKIGKIIIFLIVIALIVVGIFVYNSSHEEEIICTAEGDSAINTTIDNENVTNIVNSEVTNETSENQNVEVDEVPGDMGEYYISIGKWKKFEFNTPVGENGKIEIYAEKAVQARGFSGASAHIYYLREGEVFYHNQEGNDTKLASGIIDLKLQGEDIIAVKGEGATIYVENQYITYE